MVDSTFQINIYIGTAINKEVDNITQWDNFINCYQSAQ